MYCVIVMYIGFVTSAYAQDSDSTTNNVYVSIPALHYFVTSISNGGVIPISLVKEGDNADNYTPTPQQLFDITQAYAFFGIGLPYEKKLIDRIIQQSDIYVSIIGSTIERIPFDSDIDEEGDSHIHEDSDIDEEEDSHIHEEGDPHIWMSMDNAPILAKDIYDALLKIFPDQKDNFTQGYEKTIVEITELRSLINEVIIPYKGKTFMIYHPVLGYLAREFGLVQLSIQWKGQERSLRQMQEILNIAQVNNIKNVFIQEGFPDTSAKVIASKLGGSVETISPLMQDWKSNLIGIIDAIVNSFDL